VMRGKNGHGTPFWFVHSHEEKGDGWWLLARQRLLRPKEDDDRGVGYDGPEDRWA
jgi:hypothetical protein